MVLFVSLSPAAYRRYQAHLALQRQTAITVLRTMGMSDFDDAAGTDASSLTFTFLSIRRTPRPAGYWAEAIDQISGLGPVGIGTGDEVLSDEELASLLALKNVKAFACNGLTDAKGDALASSSVEMLWLRDAQITDSTVEKLKKTRSLRWAVLDAPGVSDAALQRLRDGRRDCVVTRATFEPPPPAPQSDVVLETDGDKLNVVRYRADRRIDWKNSFDYPAGSRMAQLVTSPGRVIVAHTSEMTALDSETGWRLWNRPASASNLFVSGDLLLSLEVQGDHRPLEVHLVGRDVKTGGTLFDTIALKTGPHYPQPIQQIGDLFLVQDGPFPQGDAGLFDRSGKLRHHMSENVIEGRHVGNIDVLLANHSVKRVPPAGDEPVTTSPFALYAGSGDDGHLISLPGGDLLAFTYGRISDSGVQLQRINPAIGAVAWKASCQPLGVAHSEYEHNVTVTVQGQTILVTSRASGGDFLELLDLATGLQIRRWRF